MATWFILRHAAKEVGDFYNPQLRHQDEPISYKGWVQAQKLPDYFVDKKISRIYVSAYQRTLQTASLVAQELSLTAIVDERLNEIDNGLFDGAGEGEIQQKFPREWQAFRVRKADFRFPEGETGEEAQARVVNFLNEKRAQHEDENTLIVSHEGLIRLLMCYVTNNPVYNRWNFYVDFCGLMELTYQPDYRAWKLIRFNQACG